MAVERIADAQVQALISSGAAEAQKQLNEDDKDAAKKKAAEKKVVEKQQLVKQTLVQNETFQRQKATDQKFNQMLGGGAGPEAQNALGGWQQNQGIQQKLTDAQKQLFREKVTQNPQQGTAAAKALNTLSQQPGFDKAIRTTQQMGTLQQGILEQPKLEKPVGEMLQSKFMQSTKAAPDTKNTFLRFGMDQAKKGNLDATKRAGDMLGTLAGNGIPKGAQKAALNMVMRNPSDAAAPKNVDAFVQQPDVRAMPNFARGKATELLAKSGGKTEVREGFEKLAGEQKFKGLNAENKGRFFATIGSGKPSEFRAITDKSLAALQSSDFPQRSGQVSRFLGKMSQQIQKNGGTAEGVDNKQLIKDAKKSPMPTAPKLQSTEGMDPEEAAKARAQNRGQMLLFFNQLEKLYSQSEKKLASAKYLEDVNALPQLRDPPGVDTSSLDPAELAIYEERAKSVKSKRDKVVKLQQQKSRELRNKRMPPAKRRAMQAEKRAIGKQPKYFSPTSGKPPAGVSPRPGGPQAQAPTGTPARPPGLAATPQRGAMAARNAQPGAAAAGGGNIQAQVAHAVAQMGTGPIDAQKAGQLAQVIAQQVAQQVAAQVTQQLMGGHVAEPGPAVGMADPNILEVSEDEKQLRKKQEREARPAARKDGWGIERPVDRDLGGARRAAVKAPPPPEAEPVAQTFEQAVNEKYTGRMLVKDPSAIRGWGDMWGKGWKDLSKPEQALWKNLGWNQQMWDTKETPAAKWPMAMATSFVGLNPTQREAVRKLMSPAAWDEIVEAMGNGQGMGVLAAKMGKNA